MTKASKLVTGRRLEVKIEKKIRLRARQDGKVIILLKKVNFLEEQHGNSGLMMKGFMRVGTGTLHVLGLEHARL